MPHRSEAKHRRRRTLVLTVLAAAGLAWAVGLGCSSGPSVMQSPEGLPPGSAIRQHAWYHQRHHTEEGFRNIYRDLEEPPLLKTMWWGIGSLLRDKESRPAPVVAPDTAALGEAPAWLRATWIGHAALYVQMPGLNLLLDPMFSRRASPFSFAGPEREAALPLRVEDLPGVDVVLLSHDHYDHLDEESIRTLAERFDPVFLVPLKTGQYLKEWGARRVAELDWWQYLDLSGYRFHCTPAEHFSGRSLGGRDRTLWAGWYVERLGGADASEDGLRLFYGGDTAYSSHFAEIRERLGTPQVAVLPVGAYLPRWLMERVHVTPEESVQAFLDLEAAHMVPVHWGTFDLADEPLHEPAERTRQAALEQGVPDRVHLIAVGASLLFRPGEAPEGSDPAARRATRDPRSSTASTARSAF